MPRSLSRLLLALSIGSFGGWLAFLAALPLAWMIGAMVLTTVAALFRAPVSLPGWLRNAMIAVLGVMLGSSFTPDLLSRLGDWTVSLAALVACTLAMAAVGFLYFRRVCGYDRTTAYFSAMPGGLSEMILVGTAMGGDGRLVALTHASRVLLVVLILPFAFALLFDYQPGSRPAGALLSSLALGDLAILAGCAVAGAVGAQALKIPAAQVVGPMLLSAVVHLAGLTRASPPVELVAASQVVIGTAIGCRFAGTALRFIVRAIAGAAGLTVLLLLVALAFAWAVHLMTGLSTPHLVLAYAPGGLAEMSLVALALAFDAAFVAAHHILRIVLVVVIAPGLFRLGAKRGKLPGGTRPPEALP